MQASRIEKIRTVGKQPVRDIEVDSPLHRFYANGIVVSNSHALSYAMYSAVGLWFKAYYPLQYMCANLTVTERASARLNQRVRYCQSKGFRVYPPDVRYAENKWIIHEGGLMAPLGNLKGFGTNDVTAVIENRPYSSVTDFMDKTKLGKSKFETLVFGGALDCFGEREYLYNWYHEFYAKQSRKPRRVELFFEDMEQSDCFEIKTSFSPIELETMFEELNGFSIQEDLKVKYKKLFTENSSLKTIREALDRNTNKHFRMLCKVRSVSTFRAKSGREFAKLEFTDGVDSIETVMQKINYSRYQKLLKAGNVIILPVQLAEGEGIYIDDLDKKEIKVLES